jgi:hypothetical protein
MSIESTSQLESMHNENIQNKNIIRQISNINVDIPPDYNAELIHYIDTPPKYEEPKNIERIIKNNNSNSKPNRSEYIPPKRKGACCYSAESDDSRCCGACYWLCPSSADEEQNNCCPSTFCEYWKSGYIQTTDGTLRDEERCDECECDDCFWTTVCLPCKFPIFFPCFLGAVFNGCMNKICGSERNYWF